MPIRKWIAQHSEIPVMLNRRVCGIVTGDVCRCVFCLLVILALRSFVLMIAESKPLLIRLLDFALALCFGASALLLLVFLRLRFPENRWIGRSVRVLALPAGLSVAQRLRKPYSPRPVLFLSKTVLALLLVCASLMTLMISGFQFLTEDQPVLKITMTGSGRAETVEWKPPDGAHQRTGADRLRSPV